jgi:hypothetical protein
MNRTTSRWTLRCAASVLTCIVLSPAAFAQEDPTSWPLLKDPFPSTGGGGIMIHDYKPVVSGDKCKTPFRAITPDGTTYANTVEFDAVPTAGGILCNNGKWRSNDGSATGTTPFRVFIKDGISRGSP